MKILKKGGSREKGEEETKFMTHAPVVFIVNYVLTIRLYGKEDQDGFNELAD
jgi:hypothetical protein